MSDNKRDCLAGRLRLSDNKRDCLAGRQAGGAAGGVVGDLRKDLAASQPQSAAVPTRLLLASSSG